MAAVRDNRFTRSGLTWLRSWVGDHGGRYEWTTGTATVWRDGHDYRANVGGVTSERSWPTLMAAMAAAEQQMRRATHG